MIVEPKEFFDASLRLGASKGNFLLSIALLTEDLNPLNIAFNNGYKPWFKLVDNGIEVVLSKKEVVLKNIEEIKNDPDIHDCKYVEVFKLLKYISH